MGQESIGAVRGADQGGTDWVNHPKHYNSHPAGVECIDVIEHMTFNVGTAIKHLWRAGLKDDILQDLRKAAWYIQREIERREKILAPSDSAG